MRSTHYLKARLSRSGQSMIEFALILPVLLLLSLGVADLGRALLFNNILVNMSREGGNLASRTSQNPQFIINALTTTSAPLSMGTHGMFFISQVSAVDGGNGSVIYVITEQNRSASGETSLSSRLWWSCPSWTNGQCNLPAAASARVVSLPFTLTVGSIVYVVEALYDYTPLTNFVLKTSPILYSQTLL